MKWLPIFLLVSVSICRANIIIMRNGDRITGEILNVEGGKLTLKYPYAQNLSLDWSGVQQIQTPFPCQVMLSDGTVVSGVLHANTDEWLLTTGGSQRKVDASKIAALRPAVAAPIPPAVLAQQRGI
jgi:hypothetical protein